MNRETSLMRLAQVNKLKKETVGHPFFVEFLGIEEINNEEMHASLARKENNVNKFLWNAYLLLEKYLQKCQKYIVKKDYSSQLLNLQPLITSRNSQNHPGLLRNS